MKKITAFPASQELDDFIHSVCPVDAHIHVTMHGVWADDDYDGNFTGKPASKVTTLEKIIRAFSCNGVTYWTMELWEHDNGYRCTLVHLPKDRFLDFIRS